MRANQYRQKQKVVGGDEWIWHLQNCFRKFHFGILRRAPDADSDFQSERGN
jgi:hypothetical protein